MLKKVLFRSKSGEFESRRSCSVAAAAAHFFWAHWLFKEGGIVLNLPVWISLEEPTAPSLLVSSSSLLFSSSSSCWECPVLLRCLKNEYEEVIKKVWKSRTQNKPLWLVRGFVCQNSCFFMFLCTKNLKPSPRILSSLYPRGQRLSETD